MLLTNAQVLNALGSLTTLTQTKLPIQLAWKINLAIKSLEPFARDLDGPVQEIKTKHAVKDEEGNYLPAVDENDNPLPNTLQIPAQFIAEVNSEIENLLQQTVTVENVQFKITDFPDHIELEPTVLAGLFPLITSE